MPYLGNRPDNIVIRNAQQEFNYTATSSQTTFTGLDTNNNTLAYNPGNVEVFFNGARLEEADFTATNGTSIVLASAAATNDLVSIISTDVFEVTDTVSRQNGGTFIGDVTMSGNLTVNGTTTTIESTTLTIEDPIIHMGKDNASDALDLGFVGKYNDGSDNYWTGLLRDASDEKFKLFATQEDLSSANAVDTSAASYAKGTLVANIEGNITFDNARTFSLSGDLSGSQTFDGSGNCAITTTIQADSVEFSMLACEIDEDDMSSNSASHVPTQQSVKAYVDSQVSSGGLSDLEAKDMQMVDSTGSFIKVKEVIEYVSVDATIAGNNYADLSVAADAEFDELSMIFLNGQKLRFGDASTNDYYIGNDGSSDFKRLHINDDIIESGDELEVRYLIKS